MAEREYLTRRSVSSLSSDGEQDRTSLIEKIRNIFRPPRRHLEERLQETRQFWSDFTDNKSTRFPIKCPLASHNIRESDVNKPRIKGECLVNSNSVLQSYDQTNKTHVTGLQDKLQTSLNKYIGGRCRKHSTYSCDDETPNSDQVSFTFEETAQGSDRMNSKIHTIEFSSQPQDETIDTDNLPTLENDRDFADDLKEDYQDIKINSNKTTKRKESHELLVLLKAHSDLKKLFIAVLIICVITVMSVILLTFKLSYEKDTPFSAEDIEKIVDEYISSSEHFKKADITQIVDKHLSSSKGRDSIRTAIYCESCSRIDETMTRHYVNSDEGRCCVKDISRLLKIFSELIDKNTKLCLSKLGGVERNQTRMLSYIADLQMKIFDEKDIVSNDWPKHPDIQQNNRLINALLTRRRSAIHLVGKVKHGVLKWSSEMSEGKLSHLDEVIYLQNGGIYVVYCIISFKKDACGLGQRIGFSIQQRSETGPVIQIASVYRNCYNETNYDTELFIQKTFKLSVRQTGVIYIDMGDGRASHVAEDSQHSFGVFEL